MKRILINSSYGDELRVALVDGAKLYDLDTESPDKKLLKGSIFKAKVSRVETSLNAAFIDFGFERHGFLPLKDLSNDYFKKNKSGERECVLKKDQEILVQVTKEERGTKGAALSTQLGLAGRFLVLIPNSTRSGGISRRISGEERDQLKDSLSKLNIPENMSVIVRTNGIGRTPEELSLDLAYLIALWNEIEKTSKSAKVPSLIYSDDKLIVRVVRDYFKDDIEEILVDKKEVFDETSKFLNAIIPDHSEKIKFYNEEIPLFNRYQVESQIELAFQREISLESGGSIVIDPTEAMTTIDVNSARSTKGKDIEETAYKTNIEAAHEISRQLRLRDVGGLVVIDFIDMLDPENQLKVEEVFRKAVYNDRARVQISSISRFGLLEVSRQRLRPSLNESYDIEHVLVRGPRSLGLSILRIIGEDSVKDNTAEVHAYVPSDVASFLLNEKRNDVINIEKTNNVKILIIADPYKSRPYYKVIRIKKGETKNIDSYELTPSSPEPDTKWRDSNIQSKSLTPLVSDIQPPKMPKKKKEGLLGWIRAIAGIENKKEKPLSKKKRTFKKRKNYKKPIAKRGKKAPIKINKPKNIKNSSKQNNQAHKSKNIKQDKQNNKEIKKVTHKKKNTINEEKVDKNKSPLQEVSVKKKKKKAIPTRALNDPRQN